MINLDNVDERYKIKLGEDGKLDKDHEESRTDADFAGAMIIKSYNDMIDSGAIRFVEKTLPRIDKALEDGVITEKEALEFKKEGFEYLENMVSSSMNFEGRCMKIRSSIMEKYMKASEGEQTSNEV